MKILAIETSCDETAAAVVEFAAAPKNEKTKKLKNNGFSVFRSLGFSVLSNVVSSQVKIHAKYGGIVPEVAARKHAENIIPVLDEALKNIKNPQKNIDAIAVTQGPGLITSLRVGVDAARTLSCAWNKPLIRVNHVVAHIYANWLAPKFPISNFPIRADNPTGRIGQFPILCLVVSGGHTLLVLMKGHGKFQIIGQTLDDAAGECFDKAAKILGLGYPGGPAIAAAAAKLPITSDQVESPRRSRDNYQLPITLPRPMLNSPDFNFSFSGLKTAVLYKIRDMKPAFSGVGDAESKHGVKTASTFITQMAAETQNAIIDVLVSKIIRAAEKYNVKTVMLGGGVTANQELRKKFAESAQKKIPDSKFYIPDSKYCTDNAAMIAVAAYFNPKKVGWNKIEPDPNLVI